MRRNFGHNLHLTLAALLPALLWTQPAAASMGGLPQFDVSFFPSQLFWLAISFAVVYALLGRIALPKVQKVVSIRQQKLSTDLAAAATASAEAKAVVTAYEKSLLDARNKAQASVNALTQAAQAESAAKQAEQQKQLQQRLAEAEQRIAAARAAALSHVREIATEVAQTSLQKVADIQVSAAEIGAALDQPSRKQAA
jgi:F-type H+-transporting ATPase subunit b